jgi:hypothetical protein
MKQTVPATLTADGSGLSAAMQGKDGEHTMKKQEKTKTPADKAGKKPCGCRKPQKNPARVMQEMGREDQSTDVLGSYTGTPADGGEPVQDADDL